MVFVSTQLAVRLALWEFETEQFRPECHIHKQILLCHGGMPQVWVCTLISLIPLYQFISEQIISYA